MRALLERNIELRPRMEAMEQAVVVLILERADWNIITAGDLGEGLPRFHLVVPRLNARARHPNKGH